LQSPEQELQDRLTYTGNVTSARNALEALRNALYKFYTYLLSTDRQADRQTRWSQLLLRTPAVILNDQLGDVLNDKLAYQIVRDPMTLQAFNRSVNDSTKLMYAYDVDLFLIS